MADESGPAPAVRFLPSTSLGRAACWLAIAFIAWFGLNMVTFWLSMATEAPSGATRTIVIVLSWFGMATGIAAGVLALAALVRGDRAVAVWLCLLPALFALAFVLGELLLPH